MDYTIYFVNAPEIGRFKIGRTQDMPSRMTTLKAGAPCPLDCVAHANGPAKLEPACHDAAEARGFKRVHGEWFVGEVTPDDAAKIVQRGRVRLAKASPAEHAELHGRAFNARFRSANEEAAE